MICKLELRKKLLRLVPGQLLTFSNYNTTSGVDPESDFLWPISVFPLKKTTLK